MGASPLARSLVPALPTLDMDQLPRESADRSSADPPPVLELRTLCSRLQPDESLLLDAGGVRIMLDALRHLAVTCAEADLRDELADAELRQDAIDAWALYVLLSRTFEVPVPWDGGATPIDVLRGHAEELGGEIIADDQDAPG